MATITPTLRERPAKPFLLEVPDEENQRGRKRRRSSAHTSSAGSTTLRGRGRRRSLSANDAIEERPSSRSPELKSPGKKYAKKYQEVGNRVDKKRRSQSPSRSRSLGCKGTPKPRRRQRTRSRSRIHEDEKSEKKEESALGGINADTAEIVVED